MKRNYIVAEPFFGKREQVVGPQRVRGNYQTYAKALAAQNRINRGVAWPDRRVVVMRVLDPSRFNYSNINRR